MKELQDKIERLRLVDGQVSALLQEARGADGIDALANIKSVDDPQGELERLHTEMTALNEEIARLQSVEQLKKDAAETQAALRQLDAPVDRPILESTARPTREPAIRSLGHEFMASRERQEWLAQGGRTNSAVFRCDISLQQMLAGMQILTNPDTPPALRALFETSDFDPFEAQVSLLTPMPWGGPSLFLSQIPQIAIMTDSGIYFEKTTRTEPTDYSITEGAAYTAFTFAYTRRTFTVGKVGGYVPITGEAQEDGPAFIADINRDLVIGLSRDIDKDCVDTVEGTSGILTHTAGAESATSALYRAISNIRVNGNVEPNLIVMHSNDWDNIVVEQAQSGNYLFSGSASSDLMMTRWGKRVILDNNVAEGKALVLDTDSVRFRDRRAVEMYVAQRFQTVSEDSVNRTVPIDQMLHWVDARFAFYVRFKKGICYVTL